MLQEIWKPIPTFENLYEVSNLGRVRSLDHYVKCKGNHMRLIKGRIKRLQKDKRGKGYLITTLSNKSKLFTYTVHQLVAWVFLKGFSKGDMINHIDGNPQNNKLSNLEISNNSENQLHAVRTELRPIIGKSKYRYVYYLTNPHAIRKWAACIRYAGKTSYGWKVFSTEEEAAHYIDELLDTIGDTKHPRNFPKL